MIWAYPKQDNNGTNKKKFGYVSLWSSKGKGKAEEDMDGGSKNRSEYVQLTLEFCL